MVELGNECITIPEVLFHPSDIGLDQASLAETIYQSISECPFELQPFLYANIVLSGGNTKFPFFQEKLCVNQLP